jgi:mannose-6-phosphate isomerase-like protein (cupin superfamily)
MPDYTRVNLKQDVEDSAQKHGLAPDLEARFPSQDLGLERSGMSYQRYEPGHRLPFGHSHDEQEELYVIVSGGGRLKLDEEILDLKQWDAVRIPAGVMRNIEAGPEGLELLAFGAPYTGPPGQQDAQSVSGWWTD